MRPLFPVLTLALATACANCENAPPPAEPAPQAFRMPAEAEVPRATRRPILTRAAAFVPADAQLVVVFRSWREAVEALALRAAFDNPVGRELLESWKIAGITLTDLPGLAKLGMDVDQSLVLAILPDDTVVAVVASENPKGLLPLFAEAPGAKEAAPPSKLQGREAHTYELEGTRFTVVLHERHVQVVISAPEVPTDTVDNQLQAAFDGAALWMKRAEALPGPENATVVMWTPGDPPGEAPEDAPPPDADLLEIIEHFETFHGSDATLAALSFQGQDLVLEMSQHVRDPLKLRARLGAGAAPLLDTVPAGAELVTTSLVSEKDASLIQRVPAAMPEGLGGLSAGALTEVFTPGAAPEMFTRPGQLRGMAWARYPGALGTESLAVLETGPLPKPEEVLPKALQALGKAFGKAEPQVKAGQWGDQRYWALNVSPPIVCAPRDPLLLCGLGEGPVKQAARLAAARPANGASAATTEVQALNLAWIRLPPLLATGAEMTQKAGLGALMGEALRAVGEEIESLTFREELRGETATISLRLVGHGRPILPALLPRLNQSVQAFLPFLR